MCQNMGILIISLVFLILTTNLIHCIENNPVTRDGHNSTEKAAASEISPRQYGLVTFENENPGINDFRDQNTDGLIGFEEPSKKPFRFEDSEPETNLFNEKPDYQEPDPINTNLEAQNHDQSGYGLTFQNDNSIQNIQVNPNQVRPGQKKRRRRRRRKPRRQQLNGYGFGPSGTPNGPLAPGQDAPGGPIYPGPLSGGQNPLLDGPYQGQYPGQFYRPPRRRPSALSSITSALTSIARYDDLQCVPRLLCEVAGGRDPTPATGGSSGLMQSIVSLQPIVTLLAAYNGLATSPLFVFGRAALLGMTSRANPANCLSAYPQCPTDTEKLVEYLNNHNGGFFRFFNHPQQKYGLQQNLEQFYNQLGGQGYGLQQPGPGQFPGLVGQNTGPGLPGPLGQNIEPGLPGPLGQNFGLHPGSFGPGPNYGFGHIGNGQGYPGPISVVNQNYGIQKPGLYDEQNYGGDFTYGINKYGFNQHKNNKQDEVETNQIEKRIQNRPGITYVDSKYEDTNSKPKWSFPNDSGFTEVSEKQRFGRTIKFPQKNHNDHKEEHISNIYIPLKTDSNKEAKGFNFPQSQSNRQYIDYYDYPPYTQIFDKTKFKLDENGFYEEVVDGEHREDNSVTHEDGEEIVYVLRGNGDPNNPEIVKLKAGQKLQ